MDIDKPKHVLALIEDEPLARVPVALGLTTLGYEVISAAAGPEAVDVLGDPRVELAIVDMRLPGRLNGVGVVREARRHHPHLKVILTSGMQPDEDISEIGIFLLKPFSVAQLHELIARLLTA